MIIKNVQVFGEDGRFSPGEIHIENGCFVKEALAETEVVDGEGLFAIPGLVDIHLHGCSGYDVCDGTAEALAQMVAYEASVGVTTICLATMTLPEAELCRIMHVVSSYYEKAGVHEKDILTKTACLADDHEECVHVSGNSVQMLRSHLAGIHMEGPFINAEKKGAQAAEYVRRCDVALFRKLQKEANGLIKLVEVAPETEGAMDFIEAVQNEVTVSVGHTTAGYETAREAFCKGARHVTHLYNAMPPLQHREPGVIGAALDADCFVELICDGIHVHPAVVRATFAMFGTERMVLISDSMRATGLGDGVYTLGGQEVSVQGKLATLKDGTIAASVSNLMDCVRTAVQEMRIPLEAAVIAATMNPAKAIGIFDKCGSISVGKRADLVLLDKDLRVKQVYVGLEE